MPLNLIHIMAIISAIPCILWCVTRSACGGFDWLRAVNTTIRRSKANQEARFRLESEITRLQDRVLELELAARKKE